jgi:hypothetical protein
MGGGTYSFRVFSKDELYERKKADTSSAYMLFYIREDERDKILDPPSTSEVSQELIDKFSNEQQKFDTIYRRLDYFSDKDEIYVISEEMIKGWNSFGTFP